MVENLAARAIPKEGYLLLSKIIHTPNEPSVGVVVSETLREVYFSPLHAMYLSIDGEFHALVHKQDTRDV